MKKLTLSLLALSLFAGSSLVARAKNDKGAVEPKAKKMKNGRCGSCCKQKTCCKKSSCNTCGSRCDGRANGCSFCGTCGN